MKLAKHALIGTVALVGVGYSSSLLSRSACEDRVAQSMAVRIEETHQGRQPAVRPEWTPGVVEILKRNGIATRTCVFTQETMCSTYVGIDHARVMGPFVVSVREAFEGYSARRRFVVILGFIMELPADEITVA